MTRTAPFILASISTALLAGCATSSGGGGGGGMPSPALFAETSGTASEALDNGETLVAYNSRMSSAVEHDYDNNETRAVSAPDFSITANAQGAYDVVIDGQSYSFSAAEVQQWSIRNAGGEYSLDSWSGEVADVVDTANPAHHQVWSYWWDPDGTAISGFAVVGTETLPAALVGKANATYEGTAGAALSNTEAHNDTDYIAGDLTMSADFNANQISGNVTNIEVLGTGGGPVNGTAILNTGTISGSGFDGTIAADADLLASFQTNSLGGTYSGMFFGVNGEELGGVLAFTGEDVVGTGFISATQQP